MHERYLARLEVRKLLTHPSWLHRYLYEHDMKRLKGGYILEWRLVQEQIVPCQQRIRSQDHIHLL
jgi:hypothetical protein